MGIAGIVTNNENPNIPKVYRVRFHPITRKYEDYIEFNITSHIFLTAPVKYLVNNGQLVKNPETGEPVVIEFAPLRAWELTLDTGEPLMIPFELGTLEFVDWRKIELAAKQLEEEAKFRKEQEAREARIKTAAQDQRQGAE